MSVFNRIRARLFRKSVKRRAVRAGLLVLNVLVLALVVAFVVLNPSHTGGVGAGSSILAANTSSVPTTVQPVDQLASVDIAVTVADMTNIIESPAVINQSDSTNIQLAVASTNNTFVNKPQAISTRFPSKKQIVAYIAQAGDSVSSIAAKFGVSTNSVLWSNGLTGNGLVAGKTLLIPPVNGIVYFVKAGDTPDSLATKYRSSAEKIIAYNDAEGGLIVGDRIFIPDGQISYASGYYASYGFAWGTSAIYGFNGYDWGNCTWYVATQIPVPANWGNASTWAAGARAAGWHVSPTPSVGAIAQTPYAAGGLGHVAIVDGISPDGTQVLIRDMNGIAGFDRVGVAWEAASIYQNYITR